MGMRVRFAQPFYDRREFKAVAETLKHRQLTCAGTVRQFEERFQEAVGGGMAVAVSSCMAALHLAQMCLGIGRGDTVIVPALTHVATAHAVELVGAAPAFVDCHIGSGNMENVLVERAMWPGVKAICTMHYLGSPGYMKSLLDIARRWNVPLIEDCALALGVEHGGAGKHVGLIGDIGCFSFYPVKHITTGEGGVLLTHNPEIAERARMLRSFGLDENKLAHHVGLNYRMTEFQAALGIAQLAKLPKILARREHNAALLRRLLEEYNLLGGNYAVAARVPDGIDRDELRRKLLVESMIETSVYYVRPVPDMPYYRAKYGEQVFPVAREICSRYVTLPVGPHLDKRRIVYMAQQFRKAICALH